MIFALVALVFAAQPGAAQDTTPVRRRFALTSPCPNGPGVAFGVTGLQCASCSFRVGEHTSSSNQVSVRQRGRLAWDTPRAGSRGGRARVDTAYFSFSSPVLRRSIFAFQSEPVVLETTANSALKAGDVIEAVNGEPITTRAGGDLFTYPPNGEHVIRIRRNGTRMDVTSAVSSSCDDLPFLRVQPDADVAPGGRGRGRSPAASSQQDQARDRLVSEYSRRLMERTNQTQYDARFGFAVRCQPSCTRARARDGTDYYRFSGYPPIVTVLRGGVAEELGLREGDRVIRVDGLSILEEDGALRFQRSARREALQITVQRNGEPLTFLLRDR
jgi:hypothetical protein